MLISESYRHQQAELHQNPEYGIASRKMGEPVAALVNRAGVREILDYGAGKGRLAESIKPFLKHHVEMYFYDPAVEAWAASPSPRELVTCIDVLEHIEPEYLDGVLDDLARVTRRFGFFTIATGPAKKILSDGRNAHLIIEPPAWWLPRLMSRFELNSFVRTPGGFWVVVEAKAA